MISSFLITVSLSSASLLPVEELYLTDGAIYLGDVVDLSTYSAASKNRLSKIEIARIPQSPVAIEVSTLSLQRWAMAAVPKLRFSPPEKRMIDVRFNNNKVQTLDSEISHQRCFVTSSPIARYEIISRKNSRSTGCDRRISGTPVYFDRRDRLVRASGNLPVGKYLGRLVLPVQDIVDHGSRVIFVTRDGPVQVVRQVEALQTVSPGEKLFVKTDNGKVFSTIYRVGETE